MAKYHINYKGEPGLCKAQKSCPFGDDSDHFATREEARQAYEAAHSSFTTQRVKPKRRSRRPQSSNSYRLKPSNYVKYIVDYDYDSYHTTDEHDDSCGSEGICRCQVYENLRVTRVTPDMVEEYAKGRIGTDESDPLPPSLEQELGKQMNYFTDHHAWDISASMGYYGEEIGDVTAPRELDNVIETWYWDQGGAVDDDRVLPWLRAQGMNTQGFQPKEAVIKFLEDQDTLSPKELQQIKNAKSVEGHSVKMGRVEFDNSKLAKTKRSSQPQATDLGKSKIMGILMETKQGAPQGSWRTGYTPSVGEVKLIGDYSRFAHLKDTVGPNKQPVFIVVRSSK